MFFWENMVVIWVLFVVGSIETEDERRGTETEEQRINYAEGTLR